MSAVTGITVVSFEPLLFIAPNHQGWNVDLGCRKITIQFACYVVQEFTYRSLSDIKWICFSHKIVFSSPSFIKINKKDGGYNNHYTSYSLHREIQNWCQKRLTVSMYGFWGFTEYRGNIQNTALDGCSILSE